MLPGHSDISFRRHFPAEYAMVRDTGRKIRDASAAENKKRTCALIRGFISELLNEGVAPSKQKIAAKFKKAGAKWGIKHAVLYRKIWSTWSHESLPVDRAMVIR
jgi:hypothetical protein